MRITHLLIYSFCILLSVCSISPSKANGVKLFSLQFKLKSDASKYTWQHIFDSTIIDATNIEAIGLMEDIADGKTKMFFFCDANISRNKTKRRHSMDHLETSSIFNLELDKEKLFLRSLQNQFLGYLMNQQSELSDDAIYDLNQALQTLSSNESDEIDVMYCKIPDLKTILLLTRIKKSKYKVSILKLSPELYNFQTSKPIFFPTSNMRFDNNSFAY